MNRSQPQRRRGIRLYSALLLLLALILPLTVSPGAASAAHPAGTTISVFYPATKAAYDAWNATTSTARPPKTTTFPTGTSIVTFYFEYAGATPHTTQYEIIVHDQTGANFVTHGPFVFTRGAALHMSPVKAPGGTYPAGRYHADLLIDGRVTTSTDFTVHSVSSAVITILYPATKAAYDAWDASTSDARPPRTDTFQAGTNVVAFYFEYKHARAKVTQWRIIIHDHNGAVVASKGPFPLSYNAALAMRYVKAPSGSFPSGAYHADLLLDGRLAASTGFTVAGQGVSISAFYPATKRDYDAWLASTSTAPPAQTTSFGAGTSLVAFYFAYKGAKADVTAFAIVIHDKTGAKVATHGPFALAAGAGLHMSKVSTSSGGAFAAGAYRADLVVNAKVTLSTFFTVGQQQTAQACQASDVLATCIVPSVLRLHASLANNMEAEGTGFVIQSDATGTYLLTNKHVVDGATAATMVAISPDGHTQYHVLSVQATSSVEGSAGDLAVVKLPPTSLRPLIWGDSTRLRLLQPVISIGYGDAFNLPGPPSVTEGNISALGRDMGDGFGPVWIQHQSFINHGNSGGPLLDAGYHVVGINTLSLKNTQGIFLAIPSTLAQKLAGNLIGQLQNR